MDWSAAIAEARQTGKLYVSPAQFQALRKALAEDDTEVRPWSTAMGLGAGGASRLLGIEVVVVGVEACTGVAAVWCPNCGDCNCYRRVVEVEGGRIEHGEPMFGSSPNCPLHGAGSNHAEQVECYQCGALFMTAGERDEHELSCD